MTDCKFYIWDTEASPPPVSDQMILLWQSYKQNDEEQCISIPALVEKQDEFLKKRLLSWLYDLGETKIHDARLIDQLTLRKGLSYWWMTTLTGKHYAVSARFYDAIRLFVLESLVQTYTPSEIIFSSCDSAVAATIKTFCLNNHIHFKWNKIKNPISRSSWIRRFYFVLPNPVQAAMTLIQYIRKRWGLRNKINHAGKFQKAEVTFIDYLAHMPPAAIEKGMFASNYWTDLVGLLRNERVNVNWLHHYMQNDALKTNENTKELLARFNQNAHGLETHHLFDEVLSLRVIYAAVCDYCYLVYRSVVLKKIKYSFQLGAVDKALKNCSSPNSTGSCQQVESARELNGQAVLAHPAFDFWPLFKDEWFKSLRGPSVIINALMLNLMEKKLSQLPPQKLGIYLQENLSWEMAFIYAWRKCGHGHLIGVPHATVRYWDLRYFYDPRSYLRMSPNDLPMPDQVAVNGLFTMNAYLNGGYPAAQLYSVEALRYLYLGDQKIRRDKKNIGFDKKRILICGDFVESASHQMMTWLEEASSMLSSNYSYIVKSHPLSNIRVDNYPLVSVQITQSPLSELLSQCDAIFTSNITCAAVDAYSAGVPLIQVLDGSTFNMSPLCGLDGVAYVTNAAELSVALSAIKEAAQVHVDDIFHLDRRLPGWRKLFDRENRAVLQHVE